MSDIKVVANSVYSLNSKEEDKFYYFYNPYEWNIWLEKLMFKEYEYYMRDKITSYNERIINSFLSIYRESSFYNWFKDFFKKDIFIDLSVGDYLSKEEKIRIVRELNSKEHYIKYKQNLNSIY